MSDRPVNPPDDETYQRGETADAELQQFIHKRDTARKSNGEPRSIQKLYESSKERYDAAKRREACQAWADYHRRQAASHRDTMQRLIAWHEDQAELYEEGAA
jgi:hypothetical protein